MAEESVVPEVPTVSTTTMTLARALAYLKKTSAQLEKIPNTVYLGLAKGKDERLVPHNANQGKSVGEVEATIKANMDAITSLLLNRDIVKSALLLANQSTQVTIAGQVMSIAEAVDRKQNIGPKKLLLQAFVLQWNQVSNSYNALAAALEVERQKLQTEALKANSDKELIASQLLASWKANTPSMIDPLGIQQRKTALETEITDFLDNVDYVLSEANAVNTITVQLV